MICVDEGCLFLLFNIIIIVWCMMSGVRISIVLLYSSTYIIIIYLLKTKHLFKIPTVVVYQKRTICPMSVYVVCGMCMCMYVYVCMYKLRFLN